MGSSYFTPKGSYADGDEISFGGVATAFWETADANANYWAFELPAGGAVDVPVALFGVAIDGVDLATFNGVTFPTVGIVDNDRDTFLVMDFSADDAARIRTIGTTRALTIAPTGTLTLSTAGASSVVLSGGATPTFAFQGTVTVSSTGSITIGPANNSSIILDANATGRVKIKGGGIIASQTSVEIGILVTNDALTVGSLGTLQIPTSAANATDALAGNVNGALYLDSTGAAERFYFRHGGAWHYVAQTAGFTWPKEERVTYGHKWNVDDLAIMKVNQIQHDGAVHALPYPFMDALKDALRNDDLRAWLRAELLQEPVGV